jgi:hypothetical protein
MNAAKIASCIPLLVMIVSLAYGTYAIQNSGPSPAALANAASKTKAAAKQGLSSQETAVATTAPSGAIRDPFVVVVKAEAVPDAAVVSKTDPERAAVDLLAGVVAQMTLSATFLQGRNEIAIIDGKMYEKGGRIGGLDGTLPPLVLAQVHRNSVVLQAGEQRYVLAYPETLGIPAGKPASGGVARTGKTPLNAAVASSPRPVAGAGGSSRRSQVRSMASTLARKLTGASQ